MEIVRNFQLFLKEYEAEKQEVFYFNYSHLLSELDMIFFSYTLLYKLDCRKLKFLNIDERNHFKKVYPWYVYICIGYQKMMRTWIYLTDWCRTASKYCPKYSDGIDSKLIPFSSWNFILFFFLFLPLALLLNHYITPIYTIKEYINLEKACVYFHFRQSLFRERTHC